MNKQTQVTWGQVSIVLIIAAVIGLIIGLWCVQNNIDFKQEKYCPEQLVSYDSAKDMFKNRSGIKSLQCNYYKDNNTICTMIPQKC